MRRAAPLTARAAAITLVALGALLWAPALGGHASRPEIVDLLEYFYPVYEAFYGSVRAGAPLLWNPWQLCGMPWMGTLLPGFFYPPHAVYVVLPIDAAVAVSSVAHLGLIAVGTALFARRAGLSAAASVLAALLFTLSATVRDWQRWPYHLEAGAWLPIGALGVLDVASDARRRGIVLIALAVGASWLAGSPQVTVFLLYAWGALLLALLGRGGAMGTVSAFAGALAAGTALAAVALVPAIAMAPLTVRRAEPLSLAAMYPWGMPSPAALLGDVAMGRPTTLSLAALVLAPLALVHRGRRRLVLWALGLGLLFTVLALSPLTPAFDLYRLLPGLAWFRGPNRLLFVSQLCLAILAAIGLDAVLAVRRRTGVILVVALVGAALLEMALVPGAPPPVPNAGVSGAWPPALEDAYRRIARDAGPDRVWTLGDRSPAALPPKLPTIAGVRSVGDYEPGALRRQSEYFTYFLQGATVPDSPVPFEGRAFSLTPPPGRAPAATRRRLLDLAAVRFVVLPAAAEIRPDVHAFLRDTGLTPALRPAPGIRMAANSAALPRAFVTYRTETAPPTDELLRRLADANFDPLASSFVEGAPPAGGSGPARGAAATLVRDEPDVVEVEADLAAPGLVVLADTFHPEWVAFVDGVAAPIVATNHLFRGVYAPPGRHRVRFVYRPTALWMGAALSVAAFLGLAALALRRA